MLTNLMPKNADKFICEVCHFKCCKSSNYNAHVLTNKHKMLTNVDKENDIVAVIKWMDDKSVDGFLKLVLTALPK